MKTAMNATAIVKIVRGRKRCRSAVGADSASVNQMLRRSDLLSDLVHRGGQDRLLDDGRARDEGLVADAASTGLKRTLGTHCQGGQD